MVWSCGYSLILAPFYGIIWLIKSKQTMIQFKPTINGKTVFGLMIFVLVFLVFSSTQAATGVNQTLYYQGKLLDAVGAEVTDGSYNMRFIIYSASTGGTCQWSAKGTGANGCVAPEASALSVTVTNGLFTVLLGDTSVGGGSQNAIPATIFNDDTRYLAIQIQYGGGAYETLTPRKALAASAYSFNSQYLEGVAADQFLRSDTDTNFTSGTLNFNTGTVLEVDSIIRLPATTATTGVIYSGANTLLHTYGSNNFFAGVNAGNLTLTGVANTGVGALALNSLTSGGGNAAIGYQALNHNTTGGNNVAIGGYALQANTTGGSNTGVGYDALYSNTTGADNTAMGRDSLYANTTGYLNAAYGRLALAANTTGYYNAAFGGASLEYNTTGAGNTAVGAMAMQMNTTGGANTAVGWAALNNNTTGDGNSAFGKNTLAANTTGTNNTAVGAEALRYNTTGGGNVTFGLGSLWSNTTGSWNTALGYNALNTTTTVDGLVAIGYNALFANTTGSANTAVGASALVANTTGNGDTAVGNEALYSNTTGSYNAAVGIQALYSNTTGSANVAVGPMTLYSNTTGQMNSALGYETLSSNTTGDGNSAFGRNTLAANTTGSWNTAVGYYSLGGNTTGSFNTAIGDLALSSNTTSSGNVAVGTSALDANTTGGNNVAIGNNALESNTTVSNLTAVGYNALAANTTGGYNTAVGSSALNSNTTGVSNTAVGQGALQYNTDGDENVAVGYGALVNNTIGYGNVAVGSYALAANTTVHNSTAVGSNALEANTTGDSNTAVGSAALQFNTEGYNNVAVGNLALQGNTTGNNNSSFGQKSLQSNTEGSGNSAFGRNALFNNTTGDDNVAIGAGALLTNTTVDGLVAVGTNALAANTTGSWNTAVGLSTLAANTSGARNTALGYLALQSNTTGNENVAVGTSALWNNTTGSGNTAIGYDLLHSNTTGNDNVAVGLQSMYTNTTGSSNTAVGRYSLFSNTTADANTAVGYWSLYANTTGSGNTAVGSNALSANTTGSNNVAVGNSALTANTTGGGNTAVGVGALSLDTTGSVNSALGQGALAANTTGDNNVALGSWALMTNTTGAFNTAVGVGALDLNTTGNYNLAFGPSALLSNTTGSNNVAVGNGALATNTTVSNLTAVGSNALAANTTGTGNTAVGFDAMVLNTAGTGNSVLGYTALAANTTGSNNVAIGEQSLYSNTTGGENTAVGSLALMSNTTGQQSIAIGSHALQDNTTGDFNTAVGQMALLVNTTGSENTAVGRGALFANTTGNWNTALGNGALSAKTTGAGNVAVGYAAGDTITTGSNNTFLGSGADATAVDLTNATAIGYNASVGASNSLVLGGTGADAVNVGIGTTAPDYTLELNTASGNTTFALSDPDVDQPITVLARADTYLALGAISGASYGGGAMVGMTDGDGVSAVAALALVGAHGVADPSDSSPAVFIQALKSDGGTGYQAVGASEEVLQIKNSLTNLITVLGNGNVGIGTDTPGSLLELYGAAPVLEINTHDGTGSDMASIIFRDQNNEDFGTTLGLVGEVGGGSKGDFRILTRDGSTATDYERLRINAGNGNLGVGTDAPYGRVHSYINSSEVTTNRTGVFVDNFATNTTTDSINKYGIYVRSTGNFSGSDGEATNNYGLYVDTPTGADNNYGLVVGSGAVGIGDTSPDYTLEVGAASGDSTFVLSDPDVTHGMTDFAETDVYAFMVPLSSTAGGLNLGGASDTDAIGLSLAGVIGSTDPTDTTPAVLISGQKKNGTGAQALDDSETLLRIDNYDVGGLLTILGNGYLGIGGIVAPQYGLDVRLDNASINLGATDEAGEYMAALYLKDRGNNWFGGVLGLAGDDNIGTKGEIVLASRGFGEYGDISDHEVLRIDRDLNLGVGTNDPSGKFQVGPYLGNITYGGGAVGFTELTYNGVYTGSAIKQFRIEIDGENTPDTFKWSDDGGGTWEAAGVSITGDWQNLSDGTAIKFYNTTGHTIGQFWDFDGYPVTLAVVDDKVGIGDVTPAYGGLVVAAGVVIGSDADTNALIDDSSNGAGTTTLYVGNETIDTTNPSDIRVKQDIVSTVLTLDDLLQLQVKDFRFRPEFTTNDSLQHGLIAQEVESIYPYAISTRSDGYKMIDYRSFIPLIIKSIQDQQAQIQSLNIGAGLQGNPNGNLQIEGLEVSGQVVYNVDTVGQAKILAGATSVRIIFDHDYQRQPIVTATPVGMPEFKYGVENTDSQGFDILIDQPQSVDITFNWHAFGANQAKIFISDGTTADINLVVATEPVDEPVVGEEVVEEEVPAEPIVEDPIDSAADQPTE